MAVPRGVRDHRGFLFGIVGSTASASALSSTYFSSFFIVFGRFRLALCHSSGFSIRQMILPFEWFLWSVCFVLDTSSAFLAELLFSRYLLCLLLCGRRQRFFFCFCAFLCTLDVFWSCVFFFH